MRSASFIAFAVLGCGLPAGAAPLLPPRHRRTPPAAAGASRTARWRRQGSPASERPPQSASNDVYPAEQVRAGQALFASQCGFCHGRDAMGGETGPDLTRSQVVAEDVRGDKIGPIVHSGRPEKGMPPFAMSDADLANVVAYVHDQKRKAESNEGNRRTVDVADLQTGNAAGRAAVLQRRRRLREVPPPTGDLAGLATRLQGLQLLQRMFYPGGRGRGGKPPYAPTVTVTPPNGAPVTGRLAYRDEFTDRPRPTAAGRVVAGAGGQGRGRRQAAGACRAAAEYTDADMHDVLAYLQTLK